MKQLGSTVNGTADNSSFRTLSPGDNRSIGCRTQHLKCIALSLLYILSFTLLSPGGAGAVLAFEASSASKIENTLVHTSTNSLPTKPVMVLEEVIVSAQRIDEDLQATPLSVSAFNRSQLNQSFVDDLTELQSLSPNLTFTKGDASNAIVYIRGVGQSDSLSFAEPGVGIYLDDVYLGRTQGAVLDVIDIERIEVLRGPQGTLYGRNSIGGAIKVISSPASDTLQSNLLLSAGTYNRKDIRTSISGPLLGKKLRGRLSIAKMQRDGYQDIANSSATNADKDSYAWRTSLSYTISDSLQLDLSLDSSKERPSTSHTPELNPVGIITDPVSANFNSLNRLDIKGNALTLTWQLSNKLQLKSISAIRSIDYLTHLDLDATMSDIFGVFVDQEQDQISQELQFNVNGSDHFDSLLGIYYFREEDLNENGLFGPDIHMVNSNVNDLLSNSINDQRNSSIAVYGHTRIMVSDSNRIFLGVRHTREKKRFARRQEVFSATDTLPLIMGKGLVELTNVNDKDEWSNTSPRLGIEHQFNNESMVYFNYSWGFKSGGFDGRANDAFAATSYDEETLIAVEVGFKSQWLNRRLRVNAAIFHNDYEDLQLNSFVAQTDATTGIETFAALFTNAGKATMQGAEAELSSLTEWRFGQLYIDVSLGYLDSEFDEYIGPEGKDISKQRKPPHSPRWTARFAPRVELPFYLLLDNSADMGKLVISTDINYRSKTFTTTSSSEVLAQSGHSLVNASIAYHFAQEQWLVSLVGKNLADKRYLQYGFDLSEFPGYQLGYYGAPRTYYLNIRYQY